MNTSNQTSESGWTTVPARREPGAAFGGFQPRAPGSAFGGFQRRDGFQMEGRPAGYQQRDGGGGFQRRDGGGGFQNREGGGGFQRRDGGGGFQNREGGGFQQQPRDVPSAFAREERKEHPREAQRREAEAVAAAEAAAKRAAAEAERKRVAEATNFKSEASYPSLGGGVAAASKKPAMNFAGKVAEMAARAAEEEALRQLEAEKLAIDRALGLKPAAAAVQKPVARKLDDGTGDDFSDIDDDDEEEAPEDGEFNAEIYSGRRRGDKGVW